jgi:hypothetical protein
VKIGTGVRQGCCLSPIIFISFKKYVTKKAPEGYGFFRIGRQVIRTVKCEDDLVLLAKDGTVLRDMNDRLVETGRCYGKGVNVETLR